MYTRILRKLNSRFALEHRYAPYDLEMVMPHLATNDFQVGDRVKVIKFGSSKYGRIVTVVNPDWNGRIKVDMDGKIVSYKSDQLEMLNE